MNKKYHLSIINEQLFDIPLQILNCSIYIKNIIYFYIKLKPYQLKIMKKIFFLAVMLFAVVLVKAQDPMFVKDDKIVNLGIGLGYYPVVSASLDYCIADGIADVGSIGVGPYIGLGYRYHTTLVMGGVRGTFHYPIIEKLDTYAGLAVGFNYYMYNSSYYYYNYNSFHIEPGFFLGARYELNETLTVFGEAGYGTSYLTAGIAVKF